MAEVLLTQAVNQAEEAIETGNYGGAIETCQRILGQFPEFAGAHRIMAEAYAEQGDLEAAREAFQRTLERDPQSIQAHLGLGMLAEDAGDHESALAYLQVAWEIDPRRRDLREHVSRVSQQLYGSDGRLYLTRAALASLHFHAGRWDRAVTEAAQVLQEYPSRIDVQVRLSEALWRRGDDAQAKQVSNTILKSLPSAVVPLLILADVHRREGDRTGAERFLQQARNIDPDGVRAADLIIVGFDDQADFLTIHDIPTFDDQLVHEEPARYAPAPDFSSTQDTDEFPPVEQDAEREDVVLPDFPTQPDMPSMPQQAPADVQPFRWEDVGDEDLEVSDLDSGSSLPDPPAADDDLFSLLSDEELDQARPGSEGPSGFTGMLDSLDAAGMQPFDPTGGSEPEAPGPTPQPQAEAPRDDMMLPSEEEIEQSRPSGQRERGHTSVFDSLEAEGMEPFDPTGGVSAGSSQEAPGQAEAGDADVSDAAADDVSDWFSEFSLPSNEELDSAKPDDVRPAGFTGVLSSLDAEGMQPFDPDSPDAESEESAPLSSDDDMDGALSLDDLGHEEPFELDWSSIDDEIEEARPGEMPRGYTDELRALDDGGIEPFAFESPVTNEIDGPPDASEAQSVDDDKPESAELDLDDLTAGWAAEAGVDDAGPAAGMDAIDVIFGDEDQYQFAETEPLGPDMLYDDRADAEASGDPSEDETGQLMPEVEPDDQAEMPDDLDELITQSESVVARETLVSSISADRLGLDAALLDRARQMKQELIDRGHIVGTTPLPGTEIDESSGLRTALEKDPADIASRIALAQSLMKGSPDEALEHYRWVYRHSPDHGSEIVRDLSMLIDIMREREVGVHRLLGALYRRHGDWAAAASHYQESLTYRRPPAGDSLGRGHDG